MTNGAANKLETSRSKWKKTYGEYLLRFTSIALAMIAVFYGMYVSGVFDSGKATDAPSVFITSHKTDSGTKQAATTEEWQTAERFSLKYDAEPKLKHLLLVAASMEGSAEGELAALTEALSSYFGIDIKAVSQDKTSSGLADRYEGIIILGNGEFHDNSAIRELIARATEKKLPVFWLGGGFTMAADYYGLDYRLESEMTEVPANSLLLYKGVEIEAAGLPFMKGDMAALAEKSEILATLKLHDIFERPAIFRKGELTYLPFIPLPKFDAPLALAVTIDVFSDVLGRHEPDPRVIFRLEDINARNYGAADTSFARTVDFLLAEEIPVHLGIIPRMVDAEGNRVADIREAPAVVDYASEHPSSILLAQHGDHHHRLDPRNKGLASGDAWEFFFDDDETMGREASQAFARERLEEGLALMAEAGMKPRMFEAPHYEMSPAQQQVAETIFPVMLHQPLYFGKEHIFSSAMLPWFTRRGETIYSPSSAGYVDALEQRSVEYILYNLEQLSKIIPDPVVFVYYHPFMTEMEGREQDIVRLVEGIKELDYRFVNLFDELDPVEITQEE